jgi:thiosulfate/3-mercaptopyruvate sulfurtransferase
MKPVIAPHDAWTLLQSGGALAVDCRHELANPARGARDYAQAHVPGAVYADLDHDLSDLSIEGRGRHPLPDAAAFSAVLGRWGITRDTIVLAYDDAGGAIAARLWWMLKLAGHERVALIDGGWPAWIADGLPVTSDVPERAATTYDVRFDSARIETSAGVQRFLADGSATLVDARAAPRYRGEVEPIDPVAGHVPAAVNRPFAENLDGGRFKLPERLREEFAQLLGSRAASDVAHMCGSGVTACHNLVAMEYAGLAGSRVYAGSWSEWIGDPARPVAVGAHPVGDGDIA